jgi:hypothetical protein
MPFFTLLQQAGHEDELRLPEMIFSVIVIGGLFGYKEFCEWLQSEGQNTIRENSRNAERNSNDHQSLKVKKLNKTATQRYSMSVGVSVWSPA